MGGCIATKILLINDQELKNKRSNMTNTKRLLTMACLAALMGSVTAQRKADQIQIDNNGVMRWSKNKTEVQGFGVNYTLPFAHEYRMAQRAGVPHETAIKQDVYHMARLDMDLYRVHVWDTEISDTLGNLIANDHLKLFDFAVNEMKQRGMKFVITPIAFWGNGWPEKDDETPGFSHKYGKGGCLTNANAIEAQANYLHQFLNHVNPYTGKAYKDEPALLAFEISNEPHHGGTVDEVKAYINKMVASMRKTGCTKPIFYNMSHSIHLVEAYLNADIQGGTFQWYPTNLVANKQINGNFLPHLQEYTIPFANHPKFKKMAKIVYEFDPADVGGNIMYPDMARTFREAGMQLAAQFAYDALCWAPYNTNYGTHFMNLAYAPQKAISLKIASAVFHNVPMYQNPQKDSPLNINYSNDLAEWVTTEKYFHTNNTATKPLDASTLKEIAGCGSSPMIGYDGTGAYFLDKLMDGTWRLEVMPDAYWVKDPYTKVSPNVQKAAVHHAQRNMTIKLANLGDDFEVKAINNGNAHTTNVSNGKFDVIPGVYLLTRKGVTANINPGQTYKNIRIDEFVAPASNLKETALWNNTVTEIVEGQSFNIDLNIASPSKVNKVSAVMSINNKWETVEAIYKGVNTFSADVPAELLQVGYLNYRIMVQTDHGTTTFPGGQVGDPWSWENNEAETYTLTIIGKTSPITLWTAKTDWETSYKTWYRTVNLKPTANGETALAISFKTLPNEDPLDKSNLGYAFKYYFANAVKGRANELSQKKLICIKVTNTKATAQPIEVGLIDANGTVMAQKVDITNNINTYKLDLQTFAPTAFLVIPRPYPDFLPYQVKTNGTPFDWQSIETLQIVVKPGTEANVDLQIEKIWIE
jgi:hypothetical protein